jgi:hypothetical protein
MHAWLYCVEELDTESAYTELLTKLIQWDLECGCIREMSLRAEADIWRSRNDNQACGGGGFVTRDFSVLGLRRIFFFFFF